MNLDEVHDHFPQLQTERLLLREMQPDDAEAIFHIFADDEVMRYYRDLPKLVYTQLGMAAETK